MQFVVPQFIEVEAKIIGPISARQFIEVLATLGICYLWYVLLPVFLFIPAIFFTCMLGGILAFAKVNGQMMHYFLLNLIQTLRRPSLKVWERMPYEEPQEKQKKKEEAYAEKETVSASRLAEISLMVDTGGAYAAEESKNSNTPVKNATVSALSTEQKNSQMNYGKKE